MPTNEQLLPSAAILIESLRSIGYNFESAISDIIDNSLSANAKNIKIKYNAVSKKIYIFDDGEGMTKEELKEAMRFGSKDPLIQRSQNDLGRFGLGLKSASLSQCRKFTVISLKDEEVNAFSWDLDIVRSTNDWTVIELTSDEIRNNDAFIFFEGISKGTCVIWENFDKIDHTTSDSDDTIEKLVDDTREYLSLIFHQYLLEGIKIYVNNIEVKTIDPFLKSSSYTQHFKVQPIPITDKEGNKHFIKVTPYVLPHFSDMTQLEKEMVGGSDNYKNKQGFYIYRNKRLIIWGTWFRIVPNNELYKNARVKVEIPNSLDYMWTVDVKKSNATVPPIIRKKLFHAVQESISSSKKIYKKRARNINKEIGYDCVWETIQERDNNYYQINRSLPMLKVLYDKLDPEEIEILDLVLKDIENNLPKYEIYTSISEGKEIEISDDVKLMVARIKTFLESAGIVNKEERIQMIKNICKSEPYCKYENLFKLMMKEYGYDE